jgi:hypothetical protein
MVPLMGGEGRSLDFPLNIQFLHDVQEGACKGGRGDESPPHKFRVKACVGVREGR